MLQRLFLVSALVLMWAAGTTRPARAEAPMATTVTSESIVRLPELIRAKQVTPIFTTIVPEQIGGVNEVQEIACVTRVTREGKGVRGVKAQHVLRAFESPRPVEVLRQGKGRSNKQGWIAVPITNTTGETFDSVIVQTTLNTNKKIDGIYVRCQHRDYDLCQDCFGPNNRFMLQGLSSGFGLDGPGEAVRGAERWTFEIADTCKGGGHTVDVSSSSASDSTLRGVTILDTRTGIAVGDNPTGTASFADGDQVISSPTCP